MKNGFQDWTRKWLKHEEVKWDKNLVEFIMFILQINVLCLLDDDKT